MIRLEQAKYAVRKTLETLDHPIPAVPLVIARNSGPSAKAGIPQDTCRNFLGGGLYLSAGEHAQKRM
jgi:hypothetical protein